MAIGVFGLQVAYRLKRLEVMSTTNTHGWFGGGRQTPYYSTVDRIDFSNDTATANVRGPLSSTRYSLAATGNSNYGWFGGGFFAPPNTWYNTVDRIEYSNDSISASNRGTLLSQTRSFLAATGNSNYGWFGGGNGPSLVSIIDRLDFSNDTSNASPRGSLSLAKNKLAATGNSNYGWFGGGSTGAPLISTVERIDYTNDYTATSPRGPLSSPAGRSVLAATGNSNYGWFGGGVAPGIVATVDRIDFSNDSSTASVRGSLNVATTALGASGNANYGWFYGGGIPAYVSTVTRIDFSNDLASTSSRGPLSAAKGYGSAASGQAKGPSIKLQKAGNYGWFGGGRNDVFATITSVDRIDFANDNSAVLKGSLNTPSTGWSGLSATGNSNYGWFGGGYTLSPNANTTRVVRIDFSNDAVITSVRGPLSASKRDATATGNSNYGWFGGGFNPALPTPTTVSTADRIDFSNDSMIASSRGTILSQERRRLAATGNSNYGWFGGGYILPASPTANHYSTVDRIDFSNDSATISPRGPLSLARYSLAATGNSNYGWFGGGGGFPILAIVDRIDFSNDSTTALVRGPLSQARFSLAATGNSNYGWFGGGDDGGTPGKTATVDRINFSNDTRTASPRGTFLFYFKSEHAATSNSTR